MAVALIVAAGRGERLGAGGPKALVQVCGRPMLQWSVDALRQVPRVTTIVIALPAGRLNAAPAGTVAVAGGASRSDSVLAALNGAPVDQDDAVIVHDAARVLATAALFSAALDALDVSGADAVIAAAPVTDTIKQTEVDEGAADDPDRVRVVRATLDRSALWAIQTPQVFRRQALQAALTSDPQLLAQATDDAWLIERAGGKVVVLPTSGENLKITTPLDLRLAEMLLAERP